MKVEFKYEFGISEVIAFCALLFSGLALWQSYRSNDPFVLLGSGPTLSGAYFDKNENSCYHLAQIPIEINNSGGRSIIFRRFITDNNITPVGLANGREFFDGNEFYPTIYLSDLYIRAPYEWPIVRESAFTLDPGSGAFINAVIPPGDTWRKNIVISSQVYPEGKRTADTVFIALVAEFSNGEKLPLRSSFSIPEPNDQCTKS